MSGKQLMEVSPRETKARWSAYSAAAARGRILVS
jgi:hypothetical protein